MKPVTDPSWNWKHILFYDTDLNCRNCLDFCYTIFMMKPTDEIGTFRPHSHVSEACINQATKYFTIIFKFKNCFLYGRDLSVSPIRSRSFKEKNSFKLIK